MKQFYLLPQELWILLQIFSLCARATRHNGATPYFKLMYKTCTMCLFSSKCVYAAPDLIQTFFKWLSLLVKTAYDAKLKRQQPLQNFWHCLSWYVITSSLLIVNNARASPHSTNLDRITILFQELLWMFESSALSQV